MSPAVYEADYVVIGAGAVGMAFADVIVTESEASVVMIDRRAHPGGHWNDAYSFVRLHQPSAYYGVNSTPLGRNQKDDSGPNAGLYELASGDEVREYFDQVMRDRFLASGRVRYFPMSEYAGGRVTSLLTGDHTEVRARRKIVDAAYLGSEVPSTCSPAFGIAAGTPLVPINDLIRISRPFDRYVIIGAGKTGVDACLWLLDQGVEPSAITWVRPRDAWMIDRANIQGGEEFFERTMDSFVTQLEVITQSQSIEALFTRLESAGQLLRVDQECWPTMYRSATVTKSELDVLRRVENVVRLGHVRRIDQDAIMLEHGSVPTHPNWLYVDCSSSGLRRRPPVAVFGEDRVTLQYVVNGGQPTYSAALTAYVELTQEGDVTKNSLCHPMPITGDVMDLPRNMLADMLVRQRWAGEPLLRQWMARSRLDPTMGVASRIDPSDSAKVAVMDRYRDIAGPARSRLRDLLASSALQSGF
jgi:hypothetical protein